MTKTMPSGGRPVTLEQLSSHLQLRLEIAVVVVLIGPTASIAPGFIFVPTAVKAAQLNLRFYESHIFKVTFYDSDTIFR